MPGKRVRLEKVHLPSRESSRSRARVNLKAQRVERLGGVQPRRRRVFAEMRASTFVRPALLSIYADNP